MTTPQWLASNLITSTATFLNESTGLPADPTTVTLKYQLTPGGAVTTIVYPDSRITKSSTGVYVSEIDTTGAPGGTATVEWIGTGAVQAPGVAQWTIVPLAF